MINKTKNLIRAVKALPEVPKEAVSLESPHFVCDYNDMRCINQGADDEGINTYITTKLEPGNRGKARRQQTYHVFRLPGTRKYSPIKGLVRKFVKRPRPLVPALVLMKRTYRRHCGE